MKRCVTSHDVSKLRTLLLSEPIRGSIPSEIRGSVWLLLLGLRAEDLLAEDLNLFARSARNAVSDDNSKEQIQKDVERTRPGLQRFKQRTVRGALLRLLSLFCARRQVAYVQGFNELLAPFILLADTGGNPRIVYSLFNDFVSRFAPWMLDTSESRVFDVLKRAFKYFERLLLYHDPELFWLLEHNMMSPDLYATSWFVTLFARNFTVECVMALWDLLLLSDNPLGITFFGIATLTRRREELLSVDPSRLPETLMMLTAKSGDEVRELWHIGSEMQNTNTPPSFQRLMTDRLLRQPNLPRNDVITAARSMQASVCLQTTPDDLVAGDATFVTWDCRTEAEFYAGHLAQANWLPLDGLRTSSEHGADVSDLANSELQRAVELCRQLDKRSHVCLVGTGIKDEDNTDINILARHLTKLGIPYVSTLRGGFKVALAVAQSGSALTSVELVGFDEERYKQARTLRLNAAALARQQPQISPKRHDIPELPVVHSIGVASNSAANSSDIRLPTPPAAVAWTSNSTPKTSDDSKQSGFSNILTGNETDFSSPARPSPIAKLPSFSEADVETSSARSVQSRLNAPPKLAVPPTAPPLPEHVSPTDSMASPDVFSPNTSMSSLLASAQRSTTVFPLGGLESPRLPNSPSDMASPNPGERPYMDPAERRSAIRGSSGDENIWGTEAKPDWLSDASLTQPLELMPKGFTVNVMDDAVMSGLRLFPCRAKAERGTRMRGKNNDFRRRYVGVSKNYFLLLSPHSHKNQLLEVKFIRYLQDIVRIAFKRARPELVTFEVRADDEDEMPHELIVCIMPDGLKECVKLVKEYLAVTAPENDLDLEGTPRSTAGDDTPRSVTSDTSSSTLTNTPRSTVPGETPRTTQSNDTTRSVAGGDTPRSFDASEANALSSVSSETPRSVVASQNGDTQNWNMKPFISTPTSWDAQKSGKMTLDLKHVVSDEGPSFLATPTVSSSKFFQQSMDEESASSGAGAELSVEHR